MRISQQYGGIARCCDMYKGVYAVVIDNREYAWILIRITGLSFLAGMIAGVTVMVCCRW